MAADLEKLVVSLEANVRTFERQMARATGEAKKATSALEKSFEQTENRITSLMNSTASSVRTGMQSIAGMAAAYLSTDAIRRYSDEWVSAINRIAAANETRQGAERRASDLTDIALRSNADLASTAELYSGLTRSSRDLGASQAQVLKVTETISKAFAAGGTSAQAAAGSIIQLNQALQSGKLSGDEFNSVSEGAPVIMELLAKKLNVTRGELKDLASDGKITSKVLFEALLEGAATVEKQFTTMVPTIEQSLGRLKTALTRYFGQISTEYDISGRVASASQSAINNLDAVVKMAAVAGVAIAAAFSGGPIVAGLAAAGAAFALFGDQIQPIAGEIATIGDYGRVAFEYLTAGGTKAGQVFADYLLPHIQKIIGVLTGDLPAMASTVLNAVTSIVDGMINAFQYAADAIKIAWGAAGDAIREQMISAMNGVVDAVNSAVKKSAELINSLLAYIGRAAIAVPEIARFDNAYSGAGTRAGQAMGDAFAKRFSQTTVKDALSGVGDSIDAGIQAFRDKANAKADARAERAREAARARGLSPRNDGTLDQKLSDIKSKDDGGGGSDKLSDFEKETEALNKRVLALQREREALSLSAFEAAKAEAAHRLLDAAKKDGTVITDELRAKIDEQALAYARAKVALDESKESQKAFNDLQKFVGQSLSGFFSDIVSGGKNASEALMNLTKKLADAALQAVLLGEGPLASIFGTKGANGATGGLIGALFGGFGGSTGAPVQLAGAVPAPSFASGGYTGSGGKNDPAGIVHRGEYVLPAEVVERLGVKNVAALHKSALRGYASGGLVGGSPGMPIPRAAGYGASAPSSLTIDVVGATGNAEIQAMVAAGVQQAVTISTKTVGRNAHSMFRNADMRFA